MSPTLQICVVGIFVSKATEVTFVSCSLFKDKTFVDHYVVALTFHVSHSLVSVHYIKSLAVLAPKLCTSHSSRSNQSLIYLMLDDGGCLNATLPTDLFLSTSNHLALGMIFGFYDNCTLGIAVMSGSLPRYWVARISKCPLLDGFFRCSTLRPFNHTS